jgi:hypothetical protein
MLRFVFLVAPGCFDRQTGICAIRVYCVYRSLRSNVGRGDAVRRERQMHRTRSRAVYGTNAGAALVGFGMPQVAAAQQGSAYVRGQVRDSIAGRPLAGARVELVPVAARQSAGYVTEADTEGRYRRNDVSLGYVPS